jgi:hypothetical protein
MEVPENTYNFGESRRDLKAVRAQLVVSGNKELRFPVQDSNCTPSPPDLINMHECL